MTADVSILVKQRDNVLTVPNAALRYSPPDDAKFSKDPPKKLERSQQLAYALQPTIVLSHRGSCTPVPRMV
ncbi:MAG: hypothetical protein WDM77_05515 [Steroidobacteraceae bacterium]